MPTVYRIFKTKFAADAFDGEGARLYGGRWNSRGKRLVYTAATLSLAALEILVGINDDELLKEYSYAAAEFDETLVIDIEASGKLPSDWNLSPPSFATQRLGDQWLTGGFSAVLRVPSAVIPSESNFLINPEHKDFAKVRIFKTQPFDFDVRLAKAK